MRKLIISIITISIVGVSLFGSNLQPANKLKAISIKATKQAIIEFKKNKKAMDAYNEAKLIIVKRLNEVARGGFYNIVYVEVEGKLPKKQQDILEYLLRKKLKSLGYKIQSAKYDNIMLNWAISW